MWFSIMHTLLFSVVVLFSRADEKLVTVFCSFLQHLVVWLSVEIADCMWFVSLTGLVRRTDWNQFWLECLVILSVSRYESAVVTLHRKEKCFFCYHFQILHTEINSWFNVFWMSDTVWWRSCRHWCALFRSLSTFLWQCEGYWIIFFWQELRYSCFSCF